MKDNPYICAAGEIGHGKTYQFKDPDGHLFELYFDTERYQAPEHLRPALKNRPQKYTGKGVGVRQLDHINYLAQKVEPNSEFLQEHLGLRVSEQIVLDNGIHAGSWLYSSQAWQTPTVASFHTYGTPPIDEQ